MSWVHLTNVSGNRKVGPIKVTTTEKSSCPAECGVMDECYASGGPLAIHWNKVGEGQRGDNWDAFTKRVERFYKDELWRHNQAGDLPPNEDGKLDEQKCGQLADAASHTKGWTYTHYNPTDEHNKAVIKGMNEVGGLVVNLSADTMEQADEYSELGIAPVTVILPEDAPNMGNKTPNGLPIVVCPAQTQEDMACNRCKLCQVQDRKSIVGFKAHGSRRKKLSAKLLDESVTV
tara:strand:- start:2988 stop:3683 length:696 start_codon:yes stop_codon:yes gene_type:complete